MPRKNERKEVKIEPTFIPYIKEPEILKNTIELERKKVFTLAKEAGRILSGLMFTMGAVFCFLSLQYIVTPLFDIPGFPTLGVLLTSEFVIFLAGFLGVINIICGFILLAKE
jgi:hypothetical protein